MAIVALVYTFVGPIISSHVGFILFYPLCFRDQSLTHYYLHNIKLPLVFVPFDVIEHEYGFGWIQSTEVLVENLPFGLQ